MSKSDKTKNTRTDYILDWLYQRVFDGNYLVEFC